MNLLSDEQQEQVMLAYQRDYGSIILDYNRFRSIKSKKALQVILLRAESLLSEIVNDTNPHRKLFSQENIEFAIGMSTEIKKLINKCNSEDIGYRTDKALPITQGSTIKRDLESERAA